MTLGRYTSPFSIDKPMGKKLLGENVIVEEKVDGSQFSFCRVGDEVFFRSRGKQLDVNNPEKLFKKGIESILSIKEKLPMFLTFRCEYLESRKHNVLRYDRVPKYNVVVFDIMSGSEEYLNRELKESYCNNIGLEVVPLLFSGNVGTDSSFLNQFLERESFLGGSKVEGVVLKPIGNDIFNPDKKLLVAKMVGDIFKENHSKHYNLDKPGNSSGEIINSLAKDLTTEARWQKAYQHLVESGEIKNELQDIPKILKEVGRDTKSEEEEWIKDKLFKWAWPKINKSIIKGLPEWYKEQLK